MHIYRFGCSGWDYEEWIGPFYRSSGESKLQAYSSVFGIAEINSTFYALPTSGMVMGWTRYTPPDFLFAAKVPQTVTHEKLLDVERGASKDLEDFCKIMQPLKDAGKLGPLLIQLPPRLRFEERRFTKFFESLPDGYDFAIEFRNKSLMVSEAFELLKTHKVAYTIVDEPLLPPEVHVTADFAYVRWHGHGSEPWYNYRYSDEELRTWTSKVENLASQARVVYGFFNNHFRGYAPENCLEVLDMLGVATAAQERALERMRRYRQISSESKEGKLRTARLDDF